MADPVNDVCVMTGVTCDVLLYAELCGSVAQQQQQQLGYAERGLTVLHLGTKSSWLGPYLSSSSDNDPPFDTVLLAEVLPTIAYHSLYLIQCRRGRCCFLCLHHTSPCSFLLSSSSPPPAFPVRPLLSCPPRGQKWTDCFRVGGQRHKRTVISTLRNKAAPSVCQDVCEVAVRGACVLAANPDLHPMV